MVCQGWRDICRELVSKGSDLHALDSNSHTPLICLLKGVITEVDHLDDYSWALEIWLSDLRCSGVDLIQYGEREKRLLDYGIANRNIISLVIKPNDIYMKSRWKLVTFTYGSLPSDWHLCVEHHLEPFEEDSAPPKAIPGSWIED